MEVLRRDVDRIQRTILPCFAMGMIMCPGWDCREYIHWVALLYLQPAKDHVEIWRRLNIAAGACNELNLPEPSIEDKHVPLRDALILKVLFCCSCLPKNGPPFIRSGNAQWIQIWIEMRTPFWLDSAFCQVIRLDLRIPLA